MRLHMVCAYLAAVGALIAAGCASPTTGSAGGDPSMHVRHELLRLARQTARANGAELVSAEAVRSHHETAVHRLSGDRVSDNAPVWVLQIKGSRVFSCRACSAPPGVKPPRGGRFIVEVVDAKYFRMTDVNSSAHAVDLGRLGHVTHL